MRGLSRPIPAPGSLATGIGALPHRDPKLAVDEVLRIFPRFPYAPTLPNRGFLESIVFSDSAMLPGRVIRDGRLMVDSSRDITAEMEQIYTDYLEKNTAPYATPPEYGSGFFEMTARRLPEALLLKCQVTGPVTFGMQVVDAGKRPIYYDPQFADILGKLIALRARWCEEEIRRRTGLSRTLVILNEPYLASLGSSVVPIDRDSVVAGWQDIAALVEDGLGVHCCTNTDWAFLASLRPSVISFDAYGNAKEFLLYLDDIVEYLEAGGVVGWGIVPSDPKVFARETVDSLTTRYLGIRKALSEHLDTKLFDAQSLITPSCGVQLGTEAEAVAIMETAAAVSARVRGTAP
ncbi:MAG TPA: hypothetical protein VK450_02970 [Methanomicrobiales archaeon]|nr:hypothetical protein [Methanomicrobiales archaeon]